MCILHTEIAMHENGSWYFVINTLRRLFIQVHARIYHSETEKTSD